MGCATPGPSGRFEPSQMGLLAMPLWGSTSLTAVRVAYTLTVSTCWLPTR